MTTTTTRRSDPLLPTFWLSEQERRAAYCHHDPRAEALEYLADTLARAELQAATLAGASATEAGQ